MSLTEVRVRLPIILSVLSLLFCVNLSISRETLRLLRIAIIGLDAIVVLSNFRYRYGLKNPEVWIYTGVIVLSGLLNYRFSNSFFQAALYGGMILMSYLIIDCAQREYGEEELLNSLCNTMIVVMIIVDGLIISKGGVGSYLTGRTDTFYYIGSKFTVSYFNMLLLALLMWRYQKKSRFLVLCITGVMIWVSYSVDCMTGVTGLLVMLFLYLFSSRVENVLKKPLIAIGAVILSGTFALLLQIVVEFRPIQWFLTSIVKTDLELTGRAGIFAVLERIFLEKPFFGYGYGNTAVKNVLGYGNPQNGLFDIGISYGFIGIIAFLLLAYVVVESRSIVEDEEKSMFPVLIFIYAMTVCGTVEINFSILMLIALSLYKYRGLNV